MKINNLAIEIEGFDKTGKDTLFNYLVKLGNYAYTLNVRGILTQLVYNDKFKRNITYILPYKPFIILLDVDDLDHAVRCNSTKEPKINIKKDRDAYYLYANLLRGYGIQIFTYNTSEMTPYQIAQDVIKKLNNSKIEDFIFDEPIELNSLNIYSSDDLKNEDIYYKFDIT